MLSRKLLKKKLNISTDYLIISSVIIFGIIVSSGISVYFTYKNNADYNNKKLQKEFSEVKNTITEEIIEHSWYIRSLANKIKDKNDLSAINQIISSQNKSSSNLNLDQLSNQKNLYWVDANNNLIIKNRVGIIDFPQKVPDNFGIAESKSSPWKLIISKNLPYFDNDYNVIATSFGITSSGGQYLGSIISFIDTNLIQNLIGNKDSVDSNFVILNPLNKKIIFQSNQKHFIENPEFFIGKIDEIDNQKNWQENQGGAIKRNLLDGDFKYDHYQKLDEYPLVIITGYNYQLYQSGLIKSLIKSILPSIGIGALLLGTLLLFYRRTIKPIRDLCEVARKIGYNECGDCKLPRNINCPEIYDLTRALLKIKYQKISIDKSHSKITNTNQKLKEAIEVASRSDNATIEIVKQVRAEISKNTAQAFQNLNMLKYNISNSGIPFSDQINLHLIKNIEQEISNIIRFATDELNKEFVEIKYIVDKVVLSQEKEIKTRNIDLNIFYEKNFPKKVFVDQIRLIQILSSVLNKTVKLLLDEKSINISVKNIIKNKDKCFAIKIEDNGIGIGIKDHLESARRLGGSDEDAINGIDISIKTIEELIKLHNGEIVYGNEISKGSSTTIIIPHIAKEQKSKPKIDKSILDNIVYLPLKSPN